MLVTLNVRNFAIIDSIEIQFNDGMTVLTGETGAGKSLIIDAIGLLLGKRASNDMIRYNENKAVIEGFFSIDSFIIQEKLEKLGIELNPDEYLVIKRELYNNGKNVCRINNVTVSLSQLSEISEYIGDIHSQLDTLGLINPKNYLYFLSSSNIQNLLNDYIIALKEYKDNEKEYQNLIQKNQDNLEKKDFLTFQYKEFVNTKISVDEEKALKEELSYLSHYEQIAEQIHEFYKIYNQNDLLSKIYDSLSCLEKLSSYDIRYKSLKESLEESYYNLESILSDHLLKIDHLDFDEKKFNEIQNRLSIYSDLKRKYKKDIPSLIDYFNKIRQDLEDIENYDDLLEDLEKKVNVSFHKVLKIAKNISDERKQNALELTNEVKEQLNDLQLKNTNFEIVFSSSSEESNVIFYKDGIDIVDFMVSFNKGEPLKPLSKVVSGGEMSRFMLALKSILVNKMPIGTKIFDEVDTGVSGIAAHSIAQKIKSISLKSQVLCVTHLPQVAAMGTHHLKISKEIMDGRTFTKIKELNKEERIDEIASMISNGEATNSSKEVAKELLDNIANI